MSLNVTLFNESLKQMHLFPASLLECNKLQKLAMKRQAEQSNKKLGKGPSLQLTRTPTGQGRPSSGLVTFIHGRCQVLGGAEANISGNHPATILGQ